MKHAWPLGLATAVLAAVVPAGKAAPVDAGKSCAAALRIAATLPEVTRTGRSPARLLEDGRSAWRSGAPERASAAWLEAAQGFHEAGDHGGEAEALLRAAQARSALGFGVQARSLLERTLELATAPETRGTRAAALGALAVLELDADVPVEAATRVGEALEIAPASGRLRASLLRTRGEIELAQGAPDLARANFSEAAELARESGDPLLAAQSTAFLARAVGREGDTAAAAATLGQVRELAAGLPASDAKAELLLHTASTREEIGDAAGAEFDVRAALSVAESAGAGRATSYALGTLGALAEKRGASDAALELTRRARAAGQHAEAPDAIYRWDWQTARLLAARGDEAGAVEAYRRAVDHAERLRSAGSGTGLDFREAVEPVYYGLVDLLLERANRAAEATARVQLLREARDHLEELKSAELREHFHDPCLAAATTQAAGSVAGAVIVYPVMLAGRTELIVSHDGTLDSVRVDVGAQELSDTIRSFRSELQRRTTRRYRTPSAQLYEWLIRPLEPFLADKQIDALVFVPSGELRTIPMAALYDRPNKQFLVEKVPLAVIPALTLTDPRPIDRGNVRALLAGLTESVQGYPALVSVEPELSEVGELLQGDELLNDEFVAEAVAAALENEDFGIVHIASHGEFRAESSESFLLTYDGRLAMDELAVLVERTKYRDQPIELLTLSACQTAAGDDKAALGLAGVAVRAGARSAIATLWAVNDRAAADLIVRFYTELGEEGVSRAEALRRAQLQMIESRPYGHPGYWAPFLLISNWL